MFSATRQWSGGFQPSRNYNCASEEKDPTSTRVGICNPLLKKVPWVPGRHFFLPCSRWQVRPPRSAAPVHLIPSDHSCCEPMKPMLNMDLAIWGSGFAFRWHMYIYIHIYIWRMGITGAKFCTPQYVLFAIFSGPKATKTRQSIEVFNVFFSLLIFLSKTHKIEGSV